jgi:hypothetical protein
VDDLISSICNANPDRGEFNIHRRIIKLAEELGEVSEAYLNVTSVNNGKNKTWDDVREEFADVLIVAVDVALTPLGGFNDNITETLHERWSHTLCVHDDSIDDAMLSMMERIGQLSRLFLTYRHAVATSHPAVNEFRLNLRTAMINMVLETSSATYTAMPDQLGFSISELHRNLAKEIERKLAKWARNRDTGKVATDAE